MAYFPMPGVARGLAFGNQAQGGQLEARRNPVWLHGMGQRTAASPV